MFWGWVIFGALIGALASQRRGFNMAVGVLSGMFLGFFSPLMFFASSGRRKCPKCAEFIKREAKVCPHCRSDVAPEA
jgi:hypothetical protein